MITVVEIDQEKLFDGAFVKNKRSNNIRQIKVLPKEYTISECVHLGILDMNKNIDYNTVMLNKTMFDLVPLEDILYGFEIVSSFDPTYIVSKYDDYFETIESAADAGEETIKYLNLDGDEFYVKTFTEVGDQRF